jgi:hypothetical protein
MRFTAPFLAAAAAALVIVSCSKPADPAESAKAFFEKVKAGKAEEAYKGSAFGFQAQQSQKFFESALAESGLNKIESAEYQAPEFEDGGRTAKVRANFTTTAGTKVPMDLTLTRESSGWKVFAIKSPRDAVTGIVQNRFSIVGRGPGFVAAVDRQPPPDVESMNLLVTETLLRFDRAVKERDFVPFFTHCSLAWQDQLVSGEYRPGTPRTMRVELTDIDRETGASRLHRAFQPFIDKKVDLSGIATKQPIFDSEPMVSTDGLLIATGRYDTEPYKVMFSMKFMYELPKWKLFGLDVSLRK